MMSETVDNTAPAPVDSVELGLVEGVPAARRWTQHLAEPDQAPVSQPDPVVSPATGRTGIRCSGGGIRSASLSLGAHQAIQCEERLRETQSQSVVSGGPYIAAAFATVAKTQDEGTRDPPGDDSDTELITPAAPTFYPGSPEEQYLRNRESWRSVR
jgi:hypothetical protein